jgi:hypothetical protein
MSKHKLADQLVVRVSGPLHAALEAAAAADGRPLATHVRWILNEYAERRRVSEALAAGFPLATALGSTTPEATP